MKKLLSLWAIFLTTAALGHDTWLIPDRFGVAPKTTVKLDLTSGMAFPKLDVGPKRGAPYGAFSLNALAAGETKGETKKTDPAGRVTFRLNKAGAWLLRGTDVRKSTKTDADWESDLVTATLVVKSN